MTAPSEPMSEWQRYPDAEAFLAGKVVEYVSAMPQARVLQADLLVYTSSRLMDWLDHLDRQTG